MGQTISLPPPPPPPPPPSKCSVELFNNDTGHLTKPYDRRQYYESNDGDMYTGALDNDVGMVALVSGCDDKYSVVLMQDNKGSFEANLENGKDQSYAFTDGLWGLGTLYKNTSGISIRKIPYDTKAVGKMNAQWISQPGEKYALARLFFWDYKIANGVDKDPCPKGGVRYPISHTTYKPDGATWTTDVPHRFACAYDETETKIREVRSEIPDSDPRLPMYTDLIKHICSKDKNINFLLPDGKTCIQANKHTDLGKKYCEKENNIVTKTNTCNKDNLGTSIFQEVLSEYCKKGDNITKSECTELSPGVRNSIYETFCASSPNNEKCSCYNVAKYDTVCKTNPNAAGCAKAKNDIDTFVALKGDEAVAKKLVPCDVCVGDNIYKPSGWNASCGIHINQCIQNIESGNLSDSMVNATCNIKQSVGDSTSPSTKPSTKPSAGPSTKPSAGPSTKPSAGPSTKPSAGPSTKPSTKPSAGPSTKPSAGPSAGPSGEGEQTFFTQYWWVIVIIVLLVLAGGAYMAF
jgi:hypothetical protein